MLARGPIMLEKPLVAIRTRCKFYWSFWHSRLLTSRLKIVIKHHG
jgi:hypothetical protein